MPLFKRSIEAAIIADIRSHSEDTEELMRDILDDLRCVYAANDRPAIRASLKEYRRLKREKQWCSQNSAHNPL